MIEACPMILPNQMYIHYLTCLEKILRKIQKHAREDILENRLFPDMFPLAVQARTAIGFTLRSTCPLAGREIVSFAGKNPSIDSLCEEIARTREYLGSIPEQDFSGIGNMTVSSVAGVANLKLPGWEYYLMYSLPNFFFHYGMVYAIARRAGVPLGKADYDSYHRYPEGFAFPD